MYSYFPFTSFVAIGWIGLLAKFMASSDHLAVNLAAGKALANMDERSRKDGVYDGFVYLLHPLIGETDSTNQSSEVETSSVVSIFNLF